MSFHCRLSAAFIFVGLTLSAVIGENKPLPIERRDQCRSTLDVALGVAHRMNDHYYSGGYGNSWTDSNTLEDLHNLMLAAGSDDFGSVADNSAAGKAALDPNTNWDNFGFGYNDDSSWLTLALWKIGDYKAARGGNSSPYFNSALKVYNIIVGQWDGTCGGGVWWSKDHTYKNAITNELFLLLSAQGYVRFGDPAFLNNAQLAWNWLKNSGMRNSDGLWNDGLDTKTCKNNGGNTWTYNQGVIASGLGYLAKATGDSSYLTEAEITLDATITHLTQNNILKESCDDPNPDGVNCGGDGFLFKGLWTKHVQYYLDAANDAGRTAKYAPFLWSQSSAVFHYATGSTNDPGSVWFASNNGGSVFTGVSSASGLEAHVAAAKYGTCRSE
ncbi:glycoside hydrolase family 76 protein [Pluteus cervinus]|uniref:Glycoside hydrolase family 76 protein n=1 Tax=Pluteus cervinus TaxID=181527 RepID=A0ACD3AAS1_9AGAR|nr:glycoside hydrolase family 76 protein [Pluteus cervinus]